VKELDRRRVGLRSGAIVLGVAALLTPLLAAGGSTADTPRCFFKVTGPQTRPDQTLLSKATFHCVVTYPGARARVAVQRQVKGHWMTVGQTRTTIDIVPGRSYTVSTKVPCKASTTFTGVKIRTFFALKTHSGRFVLPSQADPALCRFNSPS
jgi:hypothetical protein